MSLYLPVSPSPPHLELCTQTIINASGRKVKVFLVGKINIPKLANFVEVYTQSLCADAPCSAPVCQVEAFVLVGCPLSTLMDSKEYMTPILTPYELEVVSESPGHTHLELIHVQVALGASVEWGGSYTTDFSSLLKTPLAMDRLEPPPVSDLAALHS